MNYAPNTSTEEDLACLRRLFARNPDIADQMFWAMHNLCLPGQVSSDAERVSLLRDLVPAIIGNPVVHSSDIGPHQPDLVMLTNMGRRLIMILARPSGQELLAEYDLHLNVTDENFWEHVITGYLRPDGNYTPISRKRSFTRPYGGARSPRTGMR